jgi:CheY-like chemotaxis protein
MLALKKMLLAEDDPNDIELTLMAFDEFKPTTEVEVVRDGSDALDYLFCRGRFADRRTGNPAVVLLDIKMPKIDGVEVLRQIRAAPELRMIPVVMLTSSLEEKNLIESYRLGANAYVVKPVEFHAFVDAVKQLALFWVVLNEPPPPSSYNGTKSLPHEE